MQPIFEVLDLVKILTNLNTCDKISESKTEQDKHAGVVQW